MDERLQQEIKLLHKKFCQGISDPTRIMILYELSLGPRRVNQLTDILGMPQSTVSRHLKILRERSLVLTERDQRSIIYSLADRRVIQALDMMREVVTSIVQREAQLAEFSALRDSTS